MEDFTANWLKGMAIFSAAGVSLMLASTAAEAKASKAAEHYQDHPNERCACARRASSSFRRVAVAPDMGCPMGGGMMGHGMMERQRLDIP